MLLYTHKSTESLPSECLGLLFSTQLSPPLLHQSGGGEPLETGVPQEGVGHQPTVMGTTGQDRSHSCNELSRIAFAGGLYMESPYSRHP